MASLGKNPTTWIPYMNKDCSQEFCSFNCPQWCYSLQPSQQPYEYTNEHVSTPNFSPLILAIIGILVIALLLLCYYTIMSKYHNREHNNNNNHGTNDDELIHNNDELWHHDVSSSSSTRGGLDEDLIKSIMVCKYKKGEEEGDFVGLFNECSVCLSEFQDGECVRLMPKCGHAFHLPCIDTWLKSHSSCPLCRATIFTFNHNTTTSSLLQPPSPVVIQLSSMNQTLSSESQLAGIDRFRGIPLS